METLVKRWSLPHRAGEFMLRRSEITDNMTKFTVTLRRIRVRERLPVWGLRLILGIILMTLSEIVMWQTPLARSLLDWPILLVLYTGLAAIIMDLVVRFQANGPATLLLVAGICGLVSSSIINGSAFESLPYSLISRGLGLQTAAGLYGLLLFVSVMRGKQVEPLQVAGAVAVGVLWGVWVHWYPLRAAANALPAWLQ